MRKRLSILDYAYGKSLIDSWHSDYSAFHGVGHYPDIEGQWYLRECDVNNSFGLLGLYHLGYIDLDSPSVIIDRGFDAVIDYFCTSWWKNDPGSVAALDKTHRPCELQWAECFSKGLLLGMLSNRHNDVEKVCNWVEARLKHEYPDDYEDELVSVYKSLAAGLRSEPMKGLKKIEDQIMKCRAVRPRLLFQAWNAARTGNQAEFDKFLKKSLEHFLANIGSDPIPLDWVALHVSNVFAAGRHLGMKLPELPPKLEAALMTRESLGLSK